LRHRFQRRKNTGGGVAQSRRAVGLPQRLQPDHEAGELIDVIHALEEEIS